MSEGEREGLENTELTKQQKSVRDLFKLSFYFSQGDPGLQGDILEFLVGKGCFDDIEVLPRPPDYIMEIVAPKKHDATYGDKHDPSRIMTLEEEWKKIYFAKQDKSFDFAEELIDSILFGMIERDLEFQRRERPNRQGSEQVRPDSSNDPHASFVRKHIIYARSTGNDAFDELHRNLAVKLMQCRNASSTDPKDILNTQKELLVLKTEYEKNHPGYKLFPVEKTEYS